VHNQDPLSSSKTLNQMNNSAIPLGVGGIAEAEAEGENKWQIL